jgi:peptidoglycan/xylan/chitin deacetylase (PgdA/CDA1 family)
MKHIDAFPGMALVFLALLPCAASGTVPFAWPGGARCAVALTYDDTLQSQLDYALPALNKAGLRATFFQIGSQLQKNGTMQRWEAAWHQGHEMGDHTMLHPCGQANGMKNPGNELEDYTLARMAKELDDSKVLLGPWHKSGAPWSFAYPCGQDWVGTAHQSYAPLVAARFSAARGVLDGVADPEQVDLMDVPGVSGAHGGSTLISWVHEVESKGGWLVFYFHGVGGDYITTKAEAHQELVDYLETAKGLIWVAPFGEEAAWVKSHRKKH